MKTPRKTLLGKKNSAFLRPLRIFSLLADLEWQTPRRAGLRLENTTEIHDQASRFAVFGEKHRRLQLKPHLHGRKFLARLG